jgi:hypothetical protein
MIPGTYHCASYRGSLLIRNPPLKGYGNQFRFCGFAYRREISLLIGLCTGI